MALNVKYLRHNITKLAKRDAKLFDESRKLLNGNEKFMKPKISQREFSAQTLKRFSRVFQIFLFVVAVKSSGIVSLFRKQG